MVISARDDLPREIVPVIAALSVFLVVETAIIGDRQLITF
jgi:hypothetical protein